MTALLLTAEEIVAITRRERPSAQARVLRRLAIPFRTHPCDGMLLVSRAVAQKALGGDELVAVDDVGEVFEVNFDAMRRHGAQA